MAASHKVLSGWYLQLGQHLEAGIPLPTAIESAAGPPAASRQQLSQKLQLGQTIDTVIDQAPKWLPKSDREFIKVAATTGRLHRTCYKLSERHKYLNDLQRNILLSLIYPIGVLHLAALVIPCLQVIDFETGLADFDIAKYLYHVAVILVPIWSLIATTIILIKTENPLIPALCRALPFLGNYQRKQAVADLAAALANFVEAGMPIPQAWITATRASNYPAIKAIAPKLIPIFQQGADPIPTLKQTKILPQDFNAYYQTGAQTGKLDQTLNSLAQQYQNQAKNALRAAAITYPSILFIGVAISVIYIVFKFFSTYLKSLENFM